MSLLSAILSRDTEGEKWAKLQRLFRLMADNAGISYTLGYPLSDIRVGDSEGQKWEKLGAWAKLIADNIGGGGGGVTSIAGTANQIVASAPTGAVVLSLDSQITSIGEIIQKEFGPIALVSGASKTVAFLDLPAGSWLVSGPYVELDWNGGDPLTTEVLTTAGILPNANNVGPFYFYTSATPLGWGSFFGFAQPEVPIILAVPTRIYLCARCNFAANGIDVYSMIMAQRVSSITVQP